ncbi:hypothetical protein ACFOQM_02950 [Paenibacillus sp. GCM10012307]|uniref:Uncharacterized protein n=1 Tax=Paenibacillus roseus TaxID=2798579 RepID=A0A934J4I4_9BACL|nr:hypothetical protein [Paenibacillus roseus]MBJ6360275.1 hypothetical protein [Paenibacillus roseus]
MFIELALDMSSEERIMFMVLGVMNFGLLIHLNHLEVKRRAKRGDKQNLGMKQLPVKSKFMFKSPRK